MTAGRPTERRSLAVHLLLRAAALAVAVVAGLTSTGGVLPAPVVAGSTDAGRAFPEDLELLPRDLGSNAFEGVIVGSPTDPEATSVRMVVVRDGLPHGEVSAPVSTADGVAQFSADLVLGAGLHLYDLTLHETVDGIERITDSAAGVVVGDVIVVQGQSNAVAVPRWGSTVDDIDTTFLRTFGTFTSSPDGPEPRWHRAEGDVISDGGFVGQFALALGEELVAAHGVPIALLNGAEGGQPIEFYFDDPTDPADATTNYGALLWRLRLAGLASDVRAIVWNHGETVSPPLTTYPERFGRLLGAWRRDFGPDVVVVVAQIANKDNVWADNAQLTWRASIADTASLEGAHVFSLNGVADPASEDGLHFSANGYRAGARFAALLLGQVVFAAAPDPTAFPPQVAAVRCREITSCSTLVVDFEPTADLVEGPGAGSDFVVEGCREPVTVTRDVVIDSRSIALALTDDALALGCSAVGYPGPFLEDAPTFANANGVAALSFERVPITVAAAGAPVCGGLAVTVDLGAGQSPTSGSDVIAGTAGPDVILGRGGDDVICGGGGDDRISGGSGNDTVFGGSGDDTISGDEGNDALSGDEGRDIILGGSGHDTIDGGPGADLLSGDAGPDTVDGGAGDDEIHGADGDDTLVGGPGRDIVLGGRGNDTLQSVDGRVDRLSGNAGDDSCTVDVGIDAVFACETLDR